MDHLTGQAADHFDHHLVGQVVGQVVGHQVADHLGHQVVDHLAGHLVGHLSTLLLMKTMGQKMSTSTPFMVILKSLTWLLIAKAKMIHSPRLRSHLDLLFLVLKLNRFQNNQVQQVVVMVSKGHYFTRTQWTRKILLPVFNLDLNNNALILFRVTYLRHKSTYSR